MTEEYITRKEFEERMANHQLALTEMRGDLKVIKWVIGTTAPAFLMAAIGILIKLLGFK